MLLLVLLLLLGGLPPLTLPVPLPLTPPLASLSLPLPLPLGSLSLPRVSASRRTFPATTASTARLMYSMARASWRAAQASATTIFESEKENQPSWGRDHIGGKIRGSIKG